jgi:6-phosphogluconolactonase
MSNLLYILAGVDEKAGGGVLLCRTDGGLPEKVKLFPLTGPMYMELSGGRLDVVFRRGGGTVGVFGDVVSESFYTYAESAPDGELSDFSPPVSCEGTSGCHITRSGGDVYVANYGSGSAVKLSPDECGEYHVTARVKHAGSGPFVGRQEKAHLHQVIFTPDGEQICAVDLGIDKVVLYDRDLRLQSFVSLPPRSGARHMIFSPDGKAAYTINELDSTVHRLSYDGRRLKYVASYDLLEPGHDMAYRDLCTGAAIRFSPCGNYLYTCVRYDNSIQVFARSRDNSLAKLQHIPCGGDWPRDINISPDGKLLLSANERENTVTAFSVGEDGMLTRLPGELSVPAPNNIVFLG